MQTEAIWAAPFPQGRASSERFMNDSDNRLNKGEDKSGSIYFLSRALMIIYHRHSAVLIPLEMHAVAFCWGALRDRRVWACSDISGQGWLLDGLIVEPTVRFFFFFYFTNRAVCAGELSASPSGNLRIQSFQQTHWALLRSLDCQTTQQPGCSKPLFTLFPPPQPITCIAHKWLGISQQLRQKK